MQHDLSPWALLSFYQQHLMPALHLSTHLPCESCRLHIDLQTFSTDTSTIDDTPVFSLQLASFPALTASESGRFSSSCPIHHGWKTVARHREQDWSVGATLLEVCRLLRQLPRGQPENITSDLAFRSVYLLAHEVLRRFSASWPT